MKNLRGSGGRAVMGTVLAAISCVAAGCGDDFTQASCVESRSCPPEDGKGGTDSGGGGTGGSNANEAGSETGGSDGAGATDNAPGGTPGSAEGGDAGSAGASQMQPECQDAPDCSDGDRANGEEACVGGKCQAGNPPPAVVSVTPKDLAASVEPDGKVVIELSEAPAPTTVTPQSVQLLDAGKPVSGKISIADKVITFQPDKPLALLGSYAVSVSTSVTDVDGAPLLKAFGSSFRIRDGRWTVTPVVPGAVREYSPTLQLAGNGDALVAWLPGDTDCPATARWFNRGSGLAPAKTFSDGRNMYCRSIFSAVSPNGSALLAWTAASTTDAALATSEFRGGKWSTPTPRTYARYEDSSAAAVSDDGTMHFLSSGGEVEDVQVWQTNSAGAWSVQGQVLDSLPTWVDPQVAVAANGDAVAVWHNQKIGQGCRVAAARFSRTTAKWTSAVVITGSQAQDCSGAWGGVQVAFDQASVPLLVWRHGSELVATQYNPIQDAWSGFQVISGKVTGLSEVMTKDPPALVFDGHGFTAAFTAKNGSRYEHYAVRYDRDKDVWGEPLLLSTAAVLGAQRMPVLTADAHGNLLAVWPSPGGPAETYNVVFRRFDHAANSWSAPASVTGATMKHKYFIDTGRVALGGNASGLAAFSFVDRDNAGFNNLRLASFY